MNKSQTKKYAMIGILMLAIAIFAIYWQNNEMQTGTGSILTITYTDGTTNIFNSANQKNNLAIIDPQASKTVSTIQIELYVTPTWTSTSALSSYMVMGKTQMNILYAPTSASVYSSGPVDISSMQPTLVSGQAVVISSATISATAIQGLYSGWQHNAQYILKYTNPVPIGMTLNFADGSSVAKTATAPEIAWIFNYQSNSVFNSLSATFQINPTF